MYLDDIYFKAEFSGIGHIAKQTSTLASKIYLQYSKQ